MNLPPLTVSNVAWMGPSRPEGCQCIYCGRLITGPPCYIVPKKTDGLGRYEYDHRRVCSAEELYAYVRYEEHNPVTVNITCRMLKELYNVTPKGCLPPRSHLVQYGGPFQMPTSSMDEQEESVPMAVVDIRQSVVPLHSQIMTKKEFLQGNINVPEFALPPHTSSKQAEDGKRVGVVEEDEEEDPEETHRLKSILQCTGKEFFSHEDLLREEIRALNAEPVPPGQCVMEHFAKIVAETIPHIAQLSQASAAQEAHGKLQRQARKKKKASDPPLSLSTPETLTRSPPSQPQAQQAQEEPKAEMAVATNIVPPPDSSVPVHTAIATDSTPIDPHPCCANSLDNSHVEGDHRSSQQPKHHQRQLSMQDFMNFNHGNISQENAQAAGTKKKIGRPRKIK